jgi:hypothetical protein
MILNVVMYGTRVATIASYIIATIWSADRYLYLAVLSGHSDVVNW